MTIAFRRVFASVVLLIVLVVPMSAQQGSGTITGRASDSSGAVIPGVTVTLTSPAVMGARDAVTDERGAYRFDLLPLGVYELKFELPGFATLIREGIQITAGFSATINVSLAVATQSETITVAGQSPVVDLQNATVAVNFTTDLLQNLPTGRDIWSTLGQTPGIMMNKFDVGGSQAGQSTGLRTYGTDGQDEYLMDGVRFGNSYLDFGAAAEVQVVTASKSADLRTAGTYVNSIVKTGSNDIRGEILANWQGSRLQGNNLNDRLRGYGLTSTNRLSNYTDLNGNIGGPIKKDKIWWFVSMRDNYIGKLSLGFLKGACSGPLACTGKPLGTYVNDLPVNEQGAFYTRLDNVVLKVNAQVTPKNQVSMFGNFADKRYPYKGGEGPNALFFNTDSTIRQTFPTHLHKIQWTSMINTRITLDTSANRFSKHYPEDRRIDEYSRRDLDTQLVRGGSSGTGTGFSISTPFIADQKVWQYNLNISMVSGSHNAKVGYVRKYVPESRREGGTIGQLILYYRGGFQTPAFIETLDAPFQFISEEREQSFYINDSWRLMPKLTLNLGFRFDHANSSYPRQEKKGIGPFQQVQVVEARDVATVNGPVPRFSLVYDVFGNGKTALKASYGRYSGETGGHNSILASAVNPMALTRTRYDWNGTFPPANCYLTGCSFSPAGKTPVSVTGGRDRGVDPDLKFAYVEEYTAGLDQELMPDLSLRLNFVRKFDQNGWQSYNTAIPFSAYNIPASGVDPGRDGRSGTADDRTINLYSLDPAFVGKRTDVIRNNPALDNANTAFEATVIKRLSNNWQVLSGFNFLHRKVWSTGAIASDTSGVPQDPNTLRYNGGENYNTWTYKIMGTYEAPYGIRFSGVHRAAKGEAYGRRWNSPRLNQGVLTLLVEPTGAFFMDTVRLLDFRVEKTFNMSESLGKISAMFDLFNATNSAAVTGINNLTGTAFGTPTQTVEPRIARFSVRYTF